MTRTALVAALLAGALAARGETAREMFARSVDRRLSPFAKEKVPVYVNYGSDNFTFNTNCWAYGVDLSSASPWNSVHGHWKAGTAVSGRHFIQAAHYTSPPGVKIRFRGVDGRTVTRTVVATNQVLRSDIAVCLLDEPLPPTVHPAKLLPKDFHEYVGDGAGLPGLMLDYDEHAILSEFGPLTAGPRGFSDGRVPTDPKRRQYFEEVAMGDSGDPKFLLAGDEPVLVCCLWTWGIGKSGMGPFLTSWADDVQRAMDELCPGYRLQYLDLSKYPKYRECAAKALVDGFRAPPAAAKPRVWWHWVQGNVTKSGIDRDLAAMAEAGIGGVTIFDAGMPMPEGPVKFNTKDWDDHLLYALDQARIYGLTVTLASCSGWTSSGGPWVKPEESMKFVETAETTVQGGGRVDVELPAPKNGHGFYEDVAVLAFPRPASERQTMTDAKFTLRASFTNDAAALARLYDGRDERVFSFEAPGGVPRHFDFVFEKPYTASSLYVKLADGDWWTDSCPVAVAVSDDGGTWRELVSAEVSTCFGGQSDQDAKRIGFAEATARFWRVTLTPKLGAHKAAMHSLGELRLDRRMELGQLPFKTARVAGEPVRDVFTAAADQTVRRESIVDVTKHVKDGRLVWDAPAGEWTVLRVGMAANGRGNGPATKTGRGLEVDKLDAAAVRRHFDAYVGRIADLAELDGVSGLTGMLVDSYESGSQNWTRGFEKTLKAKLGYDFIPYLVLFSGRIVDSTADSEKRLEDFRGVVGRAFAENYCGTLQRCCREKGLEFELEPYGNFPGSREYYGSFADVPMTEFWSGLSPRYGKPYGGAGNEETALTVVGIARRGGKRIVQCEGFTTIDTGYAQTPYTVKACGDRHLALGVNRMVVHRFCHQPFDVPGPGVTLGRHGFAFERTQTWWPFVKPFVSYLARAQFLLQQGEYAAQGGGDGPRGLASGRKPGERDGDLAWLERRYDDGTVGRFIALDNAKCETRVFEFDLTGRSVEIWDPETGVISRAKAHERDGRTVVEVDFRPSGSTFVMLRPKATEGIAAPAETSGTGGTVEIPVKGAGDWSKDPEWRYFSGIREYEFEIPRAGELDLGEVRELAEVSVDGKVVATLWRPPFVCRVTAGRAKVRVANLWVNALIGDEREAKTELYGSKFHADEIAAVPECVRSGKLPEGRRAFACWRFHHQDDELVPSGLIGPVKLRFDN